MLKLIDTSTNAILGDSQTINFMELLKSKWDKTHDDTNVFQYKINNLLEKMVDDKYLLQLNPDRGYKRRTPEPILNICQPFDPNKFNFTKVAQEEILFGLVKDGNHENPNDKHMVLVNVSPISRYHSLLCPSLHECLPQVVTLDSIALALEVMFLAQDRDLRIAFNSLCAMASVNHLHYHLLMEPHDLIVEEAECIHLKGPIYYFTDQPIPAFCVEVNQNSIESASENIHKLITHLIKTSIAHNILITRGLSLDHKGKRQKGTIDNPTSLLNVEGGKETVRVVIWPRKSSAGAKMLSAFNVAVCEFSGWFPVFNLENYNNLTSEDLEKELSKWKIDNFNELCEDIKCLF